MPVALVLDQASEWCGFAVVDPNLGHFDAFGSLRPGRLFQHGLVTAKSPDPLRRIAEIGFDLRGLVREYKVKEIVVEHHNYKSMMSMEAVEALAGVMYAINTVIQEFGLPSVYRITPSHFKKVVTDSGSASKELVRKKTCEFWGLDLGEIYSLDHSDALGMAEVWVHESGIYKIRRQEKALNRQRKLKLGVQKRA